MAIFVTDNSMLSAMAECDLREVVEFGLGYKSKAEKLAAEAGKGVHKARALFWKGEPIQSCLMVFEEHYAPIVAAYPPNANDERLLLENVREILEKILRRAEVKDYPFVPMVDYVETGIKVPLTDGIELFALLDCPAQDVATGVLVPVDTKTTGKVTAWWSKKWRRASQLTGYAYAMGVWSQTSVNRAYVDVIELGKLPTAASTKCRVHKVPYAECRLEHAKSEVLVTMRSPETIKKWKEAAIFLARKCQAMNAAITNIELLQYVQAPGEFNNSCTFCQFASWCGMERSLTYLQQEFIVDKWEPWNRGV